MFEHLFFTSLFIATGSATPTLPPLQNSITDPTITTAVHGSLNKKDLLGFPKAKTIPTTYFVAQSFNNCGPASLSMAMSYFGVNVSQEELGEALRPYQNEDGDNDDKSVTLEEMAKKAEEYDLIAFHRPNGNIELLKHFITHNIPVITRTWMAEDDDIGHYRVVKGFDDIRQETIQDDSYTDKNLTYSYDTHNALWEKFNYEYLVLVPKDKLHIAEAILGDNLDEKNAWEKAAKNAQEKLAKNSDDMYARLNLSVALYNIGDYEGSVKEFEMIEHQLPFRTLWYQTEPIEAYYKLGNYEKVLVMTDQILNNQNRAFSELYLLRGKIFKQQGDLEAARAEFEQAEYYNKNLKEANEALKSML